MEKIYIKNKKMFKSKTQMVIYIIIFCFLIYAFIYLGKKEYKVELPDNERFANEFSMVSKENVFKYVNATDARMVSRGAKGIVLFGTNNEWVNYYAYIVNKIAKETGVKEIYYYDFTKNRKDNNGTYEDIVKNLSNFVTYNDRGVGEIYAPSLLVVSKDEVLLFDSDTSFVKGEITPSAYWNSITQNEKEQELFLIIVLLLFIVGGYFFMEYMLKTPDKTKSTRKDQEITDIRINKKKDYIYFENTTEIINDIFKQDVIFNIKGLENYNNTLHNELEELSKNEVKVTNEEIPEGITCENDLYSFTYRDYDLIEYGDYKSLIIKDYDYNCVNSSIPKNVKSYVIDIKNGNIISNDELLKKYNGSEESIIEQVKKRLEDTQILDEEVQIIDIDGTLNEVKSGTYGINKALSVSKNGKLMINFIVKSNKINYNDSIELN